MRSKLLALLLLLPLTLFAKDHIIIFDAGSSGTRLYLYEVEQTEKAPIITEKLNSKVKPGLTDESLWEDPHTIHTYIERLFEGANNVLSEEERAHTPIYLYATAGMRILPEEEQAFIMGEVRKHMGHVTEASGYRAIENPEQDIRVIEGSQEGLFIWIADNYQLGVLDHPKFLSPRNTYSALEMGGASAELAYFGLGAKQHTVPFKFGKYSFPIYSVGEDGYGINEGLNRMMQAHYDGSAELSGCFPEGSEFPLDNPVLRGHGDYQDCLNTIKNEIFFTEAYFNCQMEHGKMCSLLGTYQPTNIKPTNYLLTSGFYYTFKALDLADKPVHKPELANAATAFCAMPWEEMKAQYPDNPNYLISYCFNAAWFDAMMTAWQVDDKATLHAIEKHEGKDVTWTMGAAYYHVTQ